MKQKDYETYPRCGKKAMPIREIKTFDDPFKQYKCLNCSYVF